MTQRDIELALKKQRLQLESARLRDEWAYHARGVAPVFAAADSARSGWHWLKAHPIVPAMIVVSVIVIRPVLIWRLGRNLWIGWQAWRRWQRVLAPSDQQPAGQG